MPGIVGLITRMPRQRAELELRKMIATICHEPFYETGIWIDETIGVYAGWVAQKNSFSDGMPIHNETGDVTLLFSGEEFPEPGTIRQLKERGHRFEATASSYLVHLSEEDPFFPANLNGRFQGLLLDGTTGRAKLFNDRYGMHRIYYHESKDAFYFSVEAKAILAVHPELRNADARSMGEFLSCGCVLENRTLFENIHVLPPAADWTFESGVIKRKGNYFEPREWENQELLAPEDYYAQIRQVFSQNLSRYFGGKEPVGVSLTGGLDTRMIMAWYEAPEGSLPCYSFGGTFRDCQDVVVARKVAAACHQPYQVIPVDKNFLSCFSHYAERAVYLTDGCVMVSRSADLYVNERAREIAPVRMTGNYGGEVLRRVRAFKPGVPSPGVFQPEILQQVQAAAETYGGLLNGHPLSFAVFKQAPWHHFGLLALEETQLCLRSPYLDNDFVRTVFRAPPSALSNNDLSLRLIADGDPSLAKIATDRGFGGTSRPLTAAVSQAFIEFTVKAEYAYDYGMPQWVAKIDHALSPLRLERLFLGKHKFAHFRVWYRDALSEYVREMLLDRRSLDRPYLNAKRVEAIVQGHLKDGRNYTTEIHQLLTLELVSRLFLDAKSD
jgi:asparagine synthase (glutamine-hydrolysing)